MASARHLPILSVLLSMFALLFNVFLWGAALERAFIHRFTISGGGVDGGGVYQDGPKSHGHEYKGSSPFTDDFNSFVADVMGEWKLPGMAIAVVDGEDVFTQAYGYAKLPDTRATPETLWFAGSTTKAQLGASLAHLIDTTDLLRPGGGWQTAISSILRDDFVVADDWATEHLTLDDAVSHRTGMPGHYLSWDRSASLRDTVRNLRNLGMRREPRVQFEYNNLMFTVLSHVVETLTNKSVRDVLRSTIWDPLNMTSTFLDLDEAQASGLVLSRGYWYDGTAGSFRAMPVMPTTAVSGAGAVISTVVDYAKWVKALLDRHEFLSHAVHADLTRPRFLTGDRRTPVREDKLASYAVGWMRTVLHGETSIWHTGGTGTHGTMVQWLPDKKFGLVIMENYMNEAVHTIVMHRLIEDRLGIPPEKRADVAAEYLQESPARPQRVARQRRRLAVPGPSVSPAAADAATLPLAEFAGSYRSAGYGTITLSLGTDAGTLVAARPEPIWAQDWRLDWRLEHVSGDYFVAYVTSSGDDPARAEFFRASFDVGVDGTVRALEVAFGDGRVVYTRR
ncbi:Beta-lactamase/transpeptidase-like protein [Moelleriella libera RCEF 2490]|uniref:Beta-lactamase/transpeptidase-like protein n=1 Tax=Moelleriella libera RCEF 2490 TaxID=1081109 RepID=A0A166RKW5_9HYPO|nr:Beta-lactamase/transpeptidase-like protein [Moelleriella libera RCEF 2490]